MIMNFLTNTSDLTQCWAEDYAQICRDWQQFKSIRWSDVEEIWSSFTQSPEFLPWLGLLIGLILAISFFCICMSRPSILRSDGKRILVMVLTIIIIVLTQVAVYYLCKYTGTDYEQFAYDPFSPKGHLNW